MRGEWIEISLALKAQTVADGLSPCGESGLKFLKLFVPPLFMVSPHAGRVD